MKPEHIEEVLRRFFLFHHSASYIAESYNVSVFVIEEIIRANAPVAAIRALQLGKQNSDNP